MIRNCCRAVLVSLLFLVVLAGAPRMASAGGRVALVIGNGQYETGPALATPSNDAADMAQRLRAIGFDVIEQRDATRQAMADAIHQFAGRVGGADVVLFFYAGHALQMGGDNYLLPVDAKIDNASDVLFNTIRLDDLRKAMDGGKRTSILLLDACRDNPFLAKLSHPGDAAAVPGLSRVDAGPAGSLVLYAAQPNSIAPEGTDKTSPFTKALLARIGMPGSDLRQLASSVRHDVLRATDHRQTPWDVSSLSGAVELVAAGASPVVPASSPQPQKDQPEPPLVPPAQTAAGAPAPAEPAAPAASKTAPPAASKTAIPTNDCDRLAALRVPVFSADGIKLAEAIDWQKAVDACERMVKAHPEEIRFEYQLGRSYDGLKDYIPAVRHYQIAVDANFAEALNDLGAEYYNGHGVVRDYPTAFNLIKAAADAGSARGLANLSALYADGKGVRKDNARSLELAEKAVEAGNPFALVVIGNHYFNGAGVERDYKMAAQYFQQAGDLGNGYAIKVLANLYEKGYLGAPDPAKADELRLRALQVDPRSATPDPLPLYRAPSNRTYRPVHRRRYIVYRRFFGFGGCVYICF